MMTLYVSPYRRIARYRPAVNSVYERNGTSTVSSEGERLLAVDVKGDEEAYTITALVPGVETDEINVEVLNKTVSISGEFKPAAEEEDGYLLNELPAGKFSRVLTLPVELDASKAEASLKNGVFSLRVPKAEGHRPKVIKIAAV